MDKILVEVSIGELLDKISILDIKKDKIKDETKLEHILNEYKILKEEYDNKVKNDDKSDTGKDRSVTARYRAKLNPSGSGSLSISVLPAGLTSGRCSYSGDIARGFSLRILQATSRAEAFLKFSMKSNS